MSMWSEIRFIKLEIVLWVCDFCMHWLLVYAVWILITDNIRVTFIIWFTNDACDMVNAFYIHWYRSRIIETRFEMQLVPSRSAHFQPANIIFGRLKDVPDICAEQISDNSQPERSFNSHTSPRNYDNYMAQYLIYHTANRINEFEEKKSDRWQLPVIIGNFFAFAIHKVDWNRMRTNRINQIQYICLLSLKHYNWQRSH